MTTDIFIKSYRGDFEWLPGCLHSIQKYATGFRDVVIVVPDTDSWETRKFVTWPISHL